MYVPNIFRFAIGGGLHTMTLQPTLSEAFREAALQAYAGKAIHF